MSAASNNDSAGGKDRSRLSGPMTAVSMLVAAVLAAGAAWNLGWLQPLAPDGAEAPAEPRYFTLDPNLIVNFEGGGRVRYLQLGIELMTRDEQALEALERHAPVIRNDLILLLSDKTYDELMTRNGKEALREAALEQVQAVLSERYGGPGVEKLYFTNFVMQ